MNQSAVTAIDRLGGTSAVARLCEIAPASVTGWKHAGFPKSRLQFLKLLKPEAFNGLTDAELLGVPTEPAAA